MNSRDASTQGGGGRLRPARVAKRLLEAVTRRKVRRMLASAYAEPGGWAHRRIRHAARRAYGLDPAGPLRRIASRWMLDFLEEARKESFHRDPARPLGDAPLGFGDLVVEASTGDANSSMVYLYGFSDNLALFEIYRRHIRPGTACVDVGANLGMHTLVMARCTGPSGSVTAYEPDPELLRRLSRNLERNGVAHVRVRAAAAGDRPGRSAFRSASGKFNVGQGSLSAAGDRQVEVVRLDDDLSGIRRPVSLIKVDVEGGELAVLRGARRVLEAHRPVLVVEYNPEHAGFDELLGAVPYEVRVYRVTYMLDRPLEEIRRPPRRRGDFVLLPRAS